MSGRTPPEEGKAAAVRLRKVRKSFDGRTVLDGIDLDVGRGESLVVIGASGAGKSVLVKTAAGLLRPDSGTVRLDGAGAGGPGFGMLFQGGALFDSLPVWENVAFGLIHARRTARAQAREAAVETLARVGLGPAFADRWPAELSGGMRKRVALARAIAAGPAVLFFDEPTTGLDPIMGGAIDALIADCVRALGAAALTITHDMASARRIADRIAMIHGGRIVWDGPAEAAGNSGNEVVDRFVRGQPVPAFP